MDSQEAGKMQAIEIDKLNIQQLSQMKQQLDQEVGLFNDSLQQLKVLCFGGNIVSSFLSFATYIDVGTKLKVHQKGAVFSSRKCR